MGYIKKLKNNELVGGTDKHTIYPVTSAEAVFEEVSDNEFKSQKYLNNHITNERIVDNTIENDKLKDDTIDMGKLNTQLKTIIQNAYDASWKVKEEPFSLETKYDANDVVYDPATNSSYVSLTADNQGNPVNPEDEGYVEGKWRIIINGISAVESTEVIDAKVEELETEVDNKIDDAQDQLDAKIADVQNQLDAVTKEATDAALEARDAASTVESLTSLQVADAQIGYFECTNTAASGAAANETKITTTATIGTSTYTKTVGSHVKVKMAAANTHVAPVYLQFGSNTATRAQLYYDGEPASASNSWDDNETISVYYDGTYYQASNAQGGGGSKGIKELKGITGAYIVNNGNTLGQVISTGDQAACYQYIKYPVNEGDVVMVSGKGATAALLWGIVGDDNAMIAKAVGWAHEKNLVIIMPEGARFITLNSMIADNEQYSTIDSHPKWYYAKKDSIGAHEMIQEMITKAYLKEGKTLLKVGQSYELNQSVVTENGEFLTIAKEVKTMNTYEEVEIGDLKFYGANTYMAQKAVSAYDGTKDPYYDEGDYAIGRPSVADIVFEADAETIAALTEAVEITVTINGVECTTSVDSTSTAASVATAIATSFGTQEGWELTDDENGTLTLKSLTGVSTASVITSSVSSSGITVTPTATAGITTLSQYTEGEWVDVVLADYAADAVATGETDATKMWKTLTINELQGLSTAQDYIPKLYDWFGENIDGSVRQKKLAEIFSYYEKNCSIPVEVTNTQNVDLSNVSKWHDGKSPSGWFYLYPVKPGQIYKLTATSARNAYVAFFTEFVGAQKDNTGGLVPYVKGTSLITVPMNTYKILRVPEGAVCMYMMLRIRVTGTSTSSYYYPRSLELQQEYSLKDAYQEINENTKAISVEDICLDELPHSTTPTGYFTESSVWSDSSNRYGEWINLTEYAGKLLKFDSGFERYTFMSKQPPYLNDDPRLFFIYGNGIISKDTGNDVIRIPKPHEDNGQVWLWVYTYSSAAAPKNFYSVSKIHILKRSGFADFEEHAKDISLEAQYPYTKLLTRARYIDNTTNAFGLLHFSDLHGDTTACAELQKFIRNYGSKFDAVIETGDRPLLNYSQAKPVVTPELLYVLGNHDGSDSSTTYRRDTQGKEWCFNTYFAPYLESNGIILPDGWNIPGNEHENAMYWYKDYPTYGIRIIGLDCMHFYTMDEATDHQERWFASTLEDAQNNNLKVIVATHYGLDNYSGAYKKWDDENHEWKYNYVTDLTGNTGGYLMNRYTGFESTFHRMGASVTHDAWYSMYQRDPENYARKASPAVNAFGDILSAWVNNGGTCLAWICGHFHRDAIYYPTKYPNILTIHVSCAGTSRWDETYNIRVGGYSSRMLANLYYFRSNSGNNYLTIIRVGYDMDNYLRSQRYLSLNLTTGAVIVEE